MVRSTEGEGDRVGTPLLFAPCRPDYPHPHPRRKGASTSPVKRERLFGYSIAWVSTGGPSTRRGRRIMNNSSSDGSVV